VRHSKIAPRMTLWVKSGGADSDWRSVYFRSTPES